MRSALFELTLLQKDLQGAIFGGLSPQGIRVPRALANGFSEKRSTSRCGGDGESSVQLARSRSDLRKESPRRAPTFDKAGVEPVA